ncbi:MAG: hypothetical protein ILP01_01830 [Clostridia bacterium]|nr:hypothetical protein [Clostridia bacterium]
MTKRAAVIIALLLLLPAVAGAILYSKWKAKNPVVARYGDTVYEIVYDGDSYFRVDGSDELGFQLGDYLGKIGDRMTGAPVYCVKRDLTGEYLAVPGDGGVFLYTVSGRLADGEPSTPDRITALSFSRFSVFVDDPEEIVGLLALFQSETGTVFRPSDWDGSENKEDSLSYDITSDSLPGCTVWRVEACYGGSAVAAGKLGWVLKTNRKNSWYFIPESSAEISDRQLESGETGQREYLAAEIGEISGIRLMRSVFEPETTAAETTVSPSDETSSPGT